MLRHLLLVRRIACAAAPVIAVAVLNISNAIWTQFVYARSEFRPGFAEAVYFAHPMGSPLRAFAHENMWVFSIFMYFVLGMLAMGVAAYAMFDVMRRFSSVSILKVLGSAVLGLVALAALRHLVVGSFTHPVTPTILEVIARESRLSFVPVVIQLANAIVVLATWSLAVSVGVQTWAVFSSSISPDELRRRMQFGRGLLYIFSLFIVSGTVEMRILLEWPSVWASSEDGSVMREVAASVSNVAGANATLLLLVVFAWFFIVCRHRVGAIARRENSDAPLPANLEWVKANGLEDSIGGSIASIAAIVAPSFASGIVQTVSAAV